jgi:hypothetical protein
MHPIPSTLLTWPNVLIHLQLNSYTNLPPSCSGLHDVLASLLQRLQCSSHSEEYGASVQSKPLHPLAKLAILDGLPLNLMDLANHAENLVFNIPYVR